MKQGDLVQIHVLIEGRVQGVGFRYFILEKARGLEVTGWVRNTFDDKVEVLAEGFKDQIAVFLEELKKGPRQALITKFIVETNDPCSKFAGFSMRNTT